MSTAPDRCPECGSSELVWDDEMREWVCQRCGLVIDDESPPGEPDASTGVASPAEATGREPGGDTSDVPGHLRHAQERAEQLPSSKRRWIAAKQEAHRLAAVLGCPRDVADRAADMIKQAREADLTQGRSLDALAAASLMAACRMLHLVRTEEEFEAAAKVDFSEIKSAYKALVKGLDLPIPPATAHEYMAQLASELPIEEGVEAHAREVLQSVCGTEQAAGKNPLGWAAAALVSSSRDSPNPLTITQAAEAADVSTSTVRARLKELEDAELPETR